MDFVHKAYTLAETFHEGQKYGELSYVDGHLLPVSLASKMIAEGLNLSEEQVAIVEAVAFLHDVIEDTACSLSNIRDIEGCPPEVAAAVWTLTKDKHMSYACYLGIIVQGGLYTLIVKLADSMCNYRACLSNGNLKRSLKYSRNIYYLNSALEIEAAKHKNLEGNNAN